MAEVVAVIGLIASIIGVIDGIDKARSTLKKVIHTSSSLRAELLPVLGKTTAFAGLLRGIQIQCELDEADSDRLQTLCHIEEPLQACLRAATAIAARLEKVFSVGSISLSFGHILNKETKTALNILDQARPVLYLALSADQRADLSKFERTLAKSIETYVRNIAEDVRDARAEQLHRHEEVLNHMQETADRQLSSSKAKEASEILTWISQIDYKSNYHAALGVGQQLATSGHWFLKGDLLKEWIEKDEKPRLLVGGISGSGKTVLCAKTIEHISNLTLTSQGNQVILFFFFDFNDAAKSSMEGMVRSLLQQLLAKRTSIPEDIRKLHADCQSSIVARPRPSLEEWCRLLRLHLSFEENETYIFIDALDECTDTEDAALPETLDTLFRLEDLSKIKWFVTCRGDRSPAALTAQPLDFSHSTMQASHVNRDIEGFLPEAFEINPKLRSFTPEARECIVAEIAENSAGMFRYAQCQLDTLAKLRDRRLKKVKELLKVMPKDIFSSYEKILLDAQLLDDWPLIERILVFVSFSARPVTMAEVSDYSVLEEDMSGISSEDRMDLSDVLAYINMLVIVRNGTLILAHKSVQDFFEARSDEGAIFPLYQVADTYIARKCLQYLSFPQQPINDIEEARNMKEPNAKQLAKILKEYPFLDYAASQWPQHLKEKESQAEATEIMSSTLPMSSRPNLWKAWIMLQRADIWESQIQLARILCEAFIRGSYVTGWADNFWHLRRAYRVRKDAGLNKDEKVTFLSDPTEFDQAKDAAARKDSHFKAIAIQDQDDTLPENHLRFKKGDEVVIFETTQEKHWKGSITLRSGKVTTGIVLRTSIKRVAVGKLRGSGFLDLAVLLLEVALQVPIHDEMKKISQDLSCKSDLDLVFKYQFKRLRREATVKMGEQFGKAIDECLKNISWTENNSIDASLDLVQCQHDAMEKIHDPLRKMLASGFRAARKPPSWRRYGMPPPLPPFYPIQSDPRSYGRYPLQSNPPQSNPNMYQRAVVVGTQSAYSSPHWGSTSSPAYYAQSTSASPAYYAHSTSASPAYIQNGTTFISHSATAFPPSSGPSSYRPSSTTAITTSYNRFSAVYAPSSSFAISSAPQRPEDNVSPVVVVQTKEPRPEPTPISRRGTGLSLHENQQGDLETLEEVRSETDDSIDNSGPQAPTLEFDPDEQKALEQPADGGDVYMRLIHSSRIADKSNLNWRYPEELTFHLYANDSQRPTNIPCSDLESCARFEKSRDAIFFSYDVSMQLVWAQDVLIWSKANEKNRERVTAGLFACGDGQHLEKSLLQDALYIVRHLAQQGHPEAVYREGRLRDQGIFGYEKDENLALSQYMLAAENGFARACFWVGQKQEASEPLGARVAYEEGCAVKDAASLYRMAMINLRGELGWQADPQHGFELLVKAAEHADSDAPDALYMLGMIYAKKMPDIAAPDFPQRPGLARMYLEKAAFVGCSKAQLVVATLYENGELGFSLDPALSLHYNILAARRGEADAEMNISKIFLNLLESQGKDAQEIAYVYAKRAETDGLALAQFALGYFHDVGICVGPDKESAAAWYEKAAKNGHEDSIVRLKALSPDSTIPSRALVKDASQSLISTGTRFEDRRDLPVSNEREVYEIPQAPALAMESENTRDQRSPGAGKRLTPLTPEVLKPDAQSANPVNKMKKKKSRLSRLAFWE